MSHHTDSVKALYESFAPDGPIAAFPHFVDTHPFAQANRA